jgi:Acetyltransferase (GNAT) family
MIKIERLHPSEFDLLKEVHDKFMPSPDKSVAVVARSGEAIIGRIFLMAPTHVEGPWIAPSWRGGPLFKRLVDAIEIEARSEGIKSLMAYAVDATMELYLERLGYTKLPMTVWAKELV